MLSGGDEVRSLVTRLFHGKRYTRVFDIYIIKWTRIYFFQLFYDFRIIRFVKPSKIPSFFPLNFFVRLKTPTTQPSLEVWEKIIDTGGWVWRIRWMRKQLETEFLLFCLCNVRFVRWWIVIMKKDFFLLQMCPFFSWFRQSIDSIMHHNMLQ